MNGLGGGIRFLGWTWVILPWRVQVSKVQDCSAVVRAARLRQLFRFLEPNPLLSGVQTARSWKRKEYWHGTCSTHKASVDPTKKTPKSELPRILRGNNFVFCKMRSSTCWLKQRLGSVPNIRRCPGHTWSKDKIPVEVTSELMFGGQDGMMTSHFAEVQPLFMAIRLGLIVLVKQSLYGGSGHPLSLQHPKPHKRPQCRSRN